MVGKIAQGCKAVVNNSRNRKEEKRARVIFMYIPIQL
ncbi:unnamed protein product, partial [marine sediment metagenome]